MIDAASAILAELGEESLSLHAVAQRTGSSVGSMYHFFADREQLLRAVADRHQEMMADINAPSRAIPPETWRTMPARELIRTLFDAPLEYLVAHPDALVVQRLSDAGPASEFRELLTRIMRARLGDVHGPRIAATLYAVSTGTLVHLHEMRRTRLLHENIDIPEVLTAWLRHVEESLPGNDSPPMRTHTD